MARALAVALALTLLGTSGSAAAQAGDDRAVTQLEDLTLELSLKEARVEKELQAGNCAIACEALASMQRAADRICELEPGPVCDNAQRDVEQARARVRAACPDCVLAREEGKEVRAAEKPEPDVDGVEQEEALDEDQVVPMTGGAQPSEAPPAEEARGCAACTVGDRPGDDREALGWLALGAAVLVARRRRR